MIPAALWPSWSMRLLHGTANGKMMRPHSLRSALSVMLLLPGTMLTYRELSALLSEQTDQPSIRTIVNTFDETRLTAALSTLAQLAHSLDRFSSPIDYGRRRALVAGEQPRIDRSAYERICARHGWLRSTPVRLALLDDYLHLAVTEQGPQLFMPVPDPLDQSTDVFLQPPVTVKSAAQNPHRHLAPMAGGIARAGETAPLERLIRIDRQRRGDIARGQRPAADPQHSRRPLARRHRLRILLYDHRPTLTAAVPRSQRILPLRVATNATTRRPGHSGSPSR
jgi:hypothetical protein